MQRYDISIDILKFLAALLITNSHMEILYGEYSYLATGGAIGDSLFFFCSGYTLFLGDNTSFFNWYKRRINRIYPTVFAWMIVCCVVWKWQVNILDVILHGGGWFVECIMIYYVILWFVKRFCIKHLDWVFGISALIIGIRYFLASEAVGLESMSIYGSTTFKYWIFFLSVLAGAMLGLYRKRSVFTIGRPVVSLCFLSLSVALFYLLYYFSFISTLIWLQLLTIFPLIGVAFYLYKICNSSWVLNLYSKKIPGIIIKVIGGLCLEIYLVQYNLYTDKFNDLFPLNILIMFLIILLVAYLLRCLSRFWKQTFSEANYDWKNIIKLY